MNPARATPATHVARSRYPGTETAEDEDDNEDEDD
jgi:hypothetical protein